MAFDFQDKIFSYKYERDFWFKGGICSNPSCWICMNERTMSFENLEKIGVLPAITLELDKLKGMGWKVVLEEKNGKVFPYEDQLPMSYTSFLYPRDKEREDKEIGKFYDRFHDKTLVQLTLYRPFTILGFMDIDACYYPIIWDPMKNIESDSDWWVSNNRSFKWDLCT